MGAGYIGDMTNEETDTAQLREDKAGTGARGMGWALDTPKAGWTLGRVLAGVPRSVVALFVKTENPRRGHFGAEKSLDLTCGTPGVAVYMACLGGTHRGCLGLPRRLPHGTQIVKGSQWQLK